MRICYKKYLLQIIVVLACCILLSTNGYCHSLYKIKKYRDFPNSPKVHIIQDIHANAHAQSTISKIIADLRNNNSYPEVYIYLEGAVGNIPIDWFKSFPDKTVKNIVANNFMINGKISGCEYAALTLENKFYLYGVDDKLLYKQNLSFLKQTSSSANRHMALLDNLKSNLEDYINDPILSSLFNTNISLSDNDAVKYYCDMSAVLQQAGAIVPNDTVIGKLTAHINKMNSFNLNSIENQKESLLQSIAEHKKMDLRKLVLDTKTHQQFNTLIQQYMNAGYDKTLIEDFIEYIDSSMAVSDITFDDLQNEILDMEADLLQNDPHAPLTAMICSIPLIDKFFSCTLTRREYDFLKHCFTRFSPRQTELPPSLAKLYQTIYSYLNTDTFYSVAKQRDTILARNTVKFIKQHPSGLHILVTGGFHTQGICSFLEQQSISYEVITPDIRTITQGDMKKYHALLGVFGEQSVSPFLADKIVPFYSTTQNLAVATYLKHILADKNTEKFVMESQFLMQGLHIFLHGADVSKQEYIYKQMSFLEPVLVDNEKLFPVIFDNPALPPLFVSIRKRGQVSQTDKTNILHTGEVSDFKFSVIGPDSIRHLFKNTPASISFTQIDTYHQQLLLKKLTPYLEIQQGLMSSLEKLFARFDPFIHLRKYSIGGFNDTRQGLLSPGTCALYRNGPTFLGRLDRSGPSMDKEDVLRLHQTIDELARQLIEESGIDPTSAQQFSDALPLIYEVKSDVPVKRTSDFAANYIIMGEKTGDMHYRYYERLTEPDLKGFVQQLFIELTATDANPLEHQNAVLLQHGTTRLKNYFARWSNQLDTNTLIQLSPMFETMLKMEAQQLSAMSPSELLELKKQSSPINDFDLFYDKVIKPQAPYYFFPATHQTLAFDLKVWAETILIDRLKFIAGKDGIPLPAQFTADSVQSILKHYPQIIEQITPVSFFVKENSVLHDVSIKDINTLLADPFFAILNIFKTYGLFGLNSHYALSQGMSLSQMPDGTLAKLNNLRKQNGFIITRGENNYFSVNLININTFRFLTVQSEPVRNYLSIDYGNSIFQFVPAGLAPVIGFGFTQQSAKSFSANFRSQQYKQLLAKYGHDETMVLGLIRDKFHESYLPISRIIESLLDRQAYDYGPVRATRSLKVLTDGNTNLINQVTLAAHSTVKLDIWYADDKLGDWIGDIRTRYEQLHPNRQVLLITNGGFFITQKLIRKKNLPPSVLGTNLGLMIRNGRIVSPPLFNKTCLFQMNDGKIVIEKATINKQGGIWNADTSIENGFFWDDDTINLDTQTIAGHESGFRDKILLYTPMFNQGSLPKYALDERVILQIAGNRVVSIDYSPPKFSPLICGICLSIPVQLFNRVAHFYQVDTKVEYQLNLAVDVDSVQTALEAGPGLIHDKTIQFKPDSREIDMESEGWLTQASIETQESALHNQKLRSSRLALGVTDDTLILMAVDSRIQESVGATYSELAQMMQERNALAAMAFDGGSSVALYLPHLKNPAFNNNSWNGNPQPPYQYPRYPRNSQPRPLITSMIYYVEKGTMIKYAPTKTLPNPQRNVIDQSL